MAHIYKATRTDDDDDDNNNNSNNENNNNCNCNLQQSQSYRFYLAFSYLLFLCKSQIIIQELSKIKISN